MKLRTAPLDDIFLETLISLDDVDRTWARAIRTGVCWLYSTFRGFLLFIITVCRRHGDRLLIRRCRYFKVAEWLQMKRRARKPTTDGRPSGEIKDRSVE